MSGGFANVFYTSSGSGTSNATNFYITGLPVTPITNDNGNGMRVLAGLDAGANVTPIYGWIVGTTLRLQKAITNDNSWTNAGNKDVNGFSLSYAQSRRDICQR